MIKITPIRCGTIPKPTENKSALKALVSYAGLGSRLGGNPEVLPVYAFLIERPKSTILVDTGSDGSIVQKLAEDPKCRIMATHDVKDLGEEKI